MTSPKRTCSATLKNIVSLIHMNIMTVHSISITPTKQLILRHPNAAKIYTFKNASDILKSNNDKIMELN